MSAFQPGDEVRFKDRGYKKPDGTSVPRGTRGIVHDWGGKLHVWAASGAYSVPYQGYGLQLTRRPANPSANILKVHMEMALAQHLDE